MHFQIQNWGMHMVNNIIIDHIKSTQSFAFHSVNLYEIFDLVVIRHLEIQELIRFM